MADQDIYSMLGMSKTGYLSTQITREDWTTKSGSQILRELQAAHSGIRRQEFFRIRTEMLDIFRQAEILSGLEPNAIITPEFMKEAKYWEIGADYHYRAKIKGIDQDTGQEVEVYRSLSSDTMLTPEEVRAQMADMFQHEDPSGNVFMLEADLDIVFFRKGLFG